MAEVNRGEIWQFSFPHPNKRRPVLVFTRQDIILAGHSDYGTYLLDTHDGPVIPPVWDLYRRAVHRFGRVSTLIEWDDKIPEFAEVRAEAERARLIEHEVWGRSYAQSA